jgi:hypothetical protein
MPAHAAAAAAEWLSRSRAAVLAGLLAPLISCFVMGMPPLHPPMVEVVPGYPMPGANAAAGLTVSF